MPNKLVLLDSNFHFVGTAYPKKKMSRYWEIDQGEVDSTAFFRALPRYFPYATTFYAEGTVISQDVVQCYKSHSEEGDYLPAAQTIFPKSDKYRCKFSKELMDDLASLSEHHAGTELLDHLSLYKNNEPLLEWHDAFDNIILVSQTVAEDNVRSFAGELGLGYEAV